MAIPVVCFLLFLPHRLDMNLLAALFLLFCALMANITITIFPQKESVANRLFTPLILLFLASIIALLCGATSFTGGVHSPIFPLLLSITAFGSGLVSSSGIAFFLTLLAAAGHLAASAVLNSLQAGEIQLLASQIFFLFLFSFLFDRLDAINRLQAMERAKAMDELRGLAEMNRAASGFVSAVSFEMRTPLTSILGFSEMLVSKRLDPETEREYVEIIRREAENLNRLVEDLLDVSRLESGKAPLNKEPCRLDYLLEASSPFLEPACDPRTVLPQDLSGLPPLSVDVRRMQRAFQGIFSFIARRFGSGTETRTSVKQENGEVVFTLNVRNRQATPERIDGNRTLIMHRDGGEEDLDLAIARRIILAHLGSFSVIRASGGWLTLVARLPLHAEEGDIPSAS